MAKVKFITPAPKCRKALTLLDCCDGDIVIIPEDNVVGIITGFDNALEMVDIFSFEDCEPYNYRENTVCKRFTGDLVFNPNEFEEFSE